MSFYTLAISASSHDSSICLMKDDEIILAFSCERTNRIKHTEAIRQSEIEVVAKYTKLIDRLILVNIWNRKEGKPVPSFKEDPNQPQYQKILTLLANNGIKYKSLNIDNKNHHLFHAAAGYYTLGIEDAVAIVIDSMGSILKIKNCLLTETTSFFHCNDIIKPIYQNFYINNEVPFVSGWGHGDYDKAAATFNYPVTITPHVDIGKMYGAVTRYLGFYSVEAGKTMGLAGYGKENNLPPLLIDDTITSNANMFLNNSLNTFAYRYIKNPSEQIRRDMAYNVQKALEKVFVRRVEEAIKLQPTNNLILGGGCALNILGNSLIKRTFPYLNVYPEPIGMDASQSVGAALYYFKKMFPETKYKKLNTLYLGPEYSTIDTKDKLLKLVEQYNNESNLPV